jgi:hypothetical protein
MRVTKVTVTPGMNHRSWTGYFEGVPTLEKLVRMVQTTPAQLQRHDIDNVLALLQIAKPMMFSQDLCNESSTCWRNTIVVAGMKVGDIDYKCYTVHALEDSERVEGFTQMESGVEI